MDNINAREAVALGMVASGYLLVFFGAIAADLQQGLRHSALGGLLVFAGFAIFHWLTAIAAFGFPAYLLLVWARRRRHRSRYPVFDVPHIETISDKDGFTHYLHIREWNSKFIIGIDFECEVDGTRLRNQTRWDDYFPTFSTAETELRRRLHAWQCGEITIWP